MAVTVTKSMSHKANGHRSKGHMKQHDSGRDIACSSCVLLIDGVGEGSDPC